MPWKKGYLVFVNVYVNKVEQEWIEAIVHGVIQYIDGEYSIIVHVKDDKGTWVISCTIHSNNQYPIPSVNAAGLNYKLSNCTRGWDECLKGVSDVRAKHW